MIDNAEHRVEETVPTVKAISQKDLNRFWKKVRKAGENQCWIWTAFTNKTGYGSMGFRGKVMRAHRISFIIHKGEIPEGMNVCHQCDNPSCVNPQHLWLGTQLDNAADRERKGRGNQLKGDKHSSHTNRKSRPRGERHYSAKLNTEKVRQIKKLLEQQISTYVIAERFGVSQGAIFFIKSGRNWAHVA